MTRNAVLAIILFAFGCATAPADDIAGDGRQVQSIVRNTASPFCPGKTLDSCPSPKAGEWRRDIRGWVEEGVAKPEIRDRLQARVPSFDLSIPPVKSGWIIPMVALFLSTLWFFAMARRLTRRRAQPTRCREPTQSLSLDARLDDELARFD